MNPHIWHENHKQNDIRNDRQVIDKKLPKGKRKSSTLPFHFNGV